MTIDYCGEHEVRVPGVEYRPILRPGQLVEHDGLLGVIKKIEVDYDDWTERTTVTYHVLFLDGSNRVIGSDAISPVERKP